MTRTDLEISVVRFYEILASHLVLVTSRKINFTTNKDLSIEGGAGLAQLVARLTVSRCVVGTGGTEHLGVPSSAP